MITLFRKEDCIFCDEIEETFRDIVIAYKVGNVDGLSKSQIRKLPLIFDNNKVILGQSDIRKYMAEIKDLMIDWQKFQSDSCYLDEQGKVC